MAAAALTFIAMVALLARGAGAADARCAPGARILTEERRAFTGTAPATMPADLEWA
jgi:SAM-dependent methyltransferase